MSAGVSLWISEDARVRGGVGVQLSIKKRPRLHWDVPSGVSERYGGPSIMAAKLNYFASWAGNSQVWNFSFVQRRWERCSKTSYRFLAQTFWMSLRLIKQCVFEVNNVFIFPRWTPCSESVWEESVLDGEVDCFLFCFFYFKCFSFNAPHGKKEPNRK